MITVRNIRKRFGTQTVLNDVSIEFQAGKTTGVVGPSGVGKSVLLKVIMGIHKPEAGEVLINGRSVTNATSSEEKLDILSDVGVLFQGAALFDSLSVYDNISFPLLYGRHANTAKNVHTRVCEMAESLSLVQYLKSYPQEISIGTRKRVGLARALITEPKIVLFDEPNTGLDPVVGQEVYDLIALCKQQWNITGLVISHELPEAFQVCDQVAMILGGRIIERAEPTKFQESSNASVQQFLKGAIDGPIQIQ